MQLTKFLVLGALFDICITAYNLVDNYPPDAFFAKFNFFSVSVESQCWGNYPFLTRSRVSIQAMHMSPTLISLLHKLPG